MINDAIRLHLPSTEVYNDKRKGNNTSTLHGRTEYTLHAVAPLDTLCDHGDARTVSRQAGRAHRADAHQRGTQFPAEQVSWAYRMDGMDTLVLSRAVLG